LWLIFTVSLLAVREMNRLVIFLALAGTSSAAKLPWYSEFLQSEQSVIGLDLEENPYHKFPIDIKDVAVIGAGPSGLQHVVELREAGFNVRLFERRQYPGASFVSTDN
jgi:NADPH-dependent 2,4-dienoyl-CoA reductase/sulfur reductase-like enzyme